MSNFTCSIQVTDGKDLFNQLDKKDLLSNSSFLGQLLRIIKRPDLFSRLEGDGTQTDSSPIVTDYRCEQSITKDH